MSFDLRRAPAPGTVIVQSDEGARWLCFQQPEAVIQTGRVADVRACLEEVAAAVEGRGLHAAGFISYEAAPGFDRALPAVACDNSLPLLWFGLYREAVPVEPPLVAAGEPALLNWQPAVDRATYDHAFAAIRDAIARGETYQVNYTFPLKAHFDGDPWALFARMVQAQRCNYAAYLDTGRHVVASVSPELFWKLDGQRLVARPMKGTAARGPTLAQDNAHRDWLQGSEKNRAENVMIVDMIRNDVGRVARYGSVHVPALFQVERYPTVWQMTSRVACETEAAVPEIMAALFPCASITGAPKVRTMEIIAALERRPRGIYTGCIGYLSPGRRAQFSVAIRTVLVDRTIGEASYGVGGGIVWDSQAGSEYEESLLKAQVLTRQEPEFELLETLRWTPDEGYYLLDRHLRRLTESAAYFDVPLDVEGVAAQLVELATTFAGSAQRVRLLVAQAGALRCEAARLPWPLESRTLRVALAVEPVSSSDRFLYHKTTHRAIYDRARRARPGCDDVLLWNEHGELTESTIANIVVEREGELVTPPVASGLLAGTLRAELLALGIIREKLLTLDELKPGQRLWLINSVRGWLEAVLIGGG